MSVRQRVLEMLENNKGRYLSGEKLAGELSVSRSAVWKAVKALQNEGYAIFAVTNKGYCLHADNDILSKQSIERHLGKFLHPFRIEVRRAVDSTNNVLKQEAAHGEKEGKVLIAEEQTRGKGRKNRRFFAPAGAGVYMSILLRPRLNAQDATFITAAAAVAVAKSIESVSGKRAKIKWVNDVYCDNKKVCGILTEASLDMESGGVEYAVLGIGVNVNPPAGGFPDELSGLAGSIFDSQSYDADARSRLAAQILQNFWDYYKNLAHKPFLSEYRERSMLLGRGIFVIEGDAVQKAQALDIDDNCRLVVRFEDNAEKALSSGEVSIKL